MRVKIKKKYKSLGVSDEFELPNFVVLTGKNGSGKSHLMEAMHSSEFCTIINDEVTYDKIKYIPFNGLNPQVNTESDSLDIANQKKKAWNDLSNQIEEIRTRCSGDARRYLNHQNKQTRSRREKIFGYWYRLVDGDIKKLTEEFVMDNYEITSDEFFTSQFASIFKLYQLRFYDNDYLRYRNEKYHEQNICLSPEEFSEKFGPKPWELINGLLERARLSYRVNKPEGHRDSSFHLCLTDINTGVDIQVNDLSTGEKVLMSIALSIYNTHEEGNKPDVLLLDEPDAPLHPEFSKILIEAINESIVNEAGVKVIISTHSPTTIALASEESIYTMYKGCSCPHKISKQQAINILTCDLDNIRVTFDERRQVFVESKYDVQYYSKLYSLLAVSPGFTIQPQFLAPRSGNGSNCSDVIDIVSALRDKGNDLVYGIVDYDNDNSSSNAYILVLGEGERYAIENYIFDPVYVAFLLIREQIIKTTDVGLRACSYVQLQTLSDMEIQTLIDYVIDKLELSSTNQIEYNVVSGKMFTATKEYFMLKGHDLEEKIKNTWPQLERIASRGESCLKNYILEKVYYDYPAYISIDFVHLFNKIV